MANDVISQDAAQQALQLARGNLLAYIKLMFPNFQAYRHHYLLADIMERVEAGELKRVIINLPPRHTKSLICTEHFPTWAIGRDPRKQIISASFNQDLADNFGRKVQAQVTSPLYHAIFPNLMLQSDTVGMSRWETVARGAYVAVGVGGGVLGKGGNIIIIDDPYKNREEADSEAGQRRVIEWYESVIESRQQMDLTETKRDDGMDAAIVVIHQRWNDRDLTAWLLENRSYENWTHIVLPIECESEEDDILGRKKGEPLWPEAYGKPFIERLKKAPDGEYRFQSMYQQNPAPKGGSIFKTEWFADRYEKMPLDAHVRVMSWDTANKDKKKKGNDPSALGLWRVFGRKIYADRQDRRWVNYPALKLWAIDEINSYKPHFVLIEDRGSGTGLIQELRQEMAFGNLYPCHIVEINPGLLDKVTRAKISSSTPQNKAVVLPKEASWLKEYLDELMRFPAGKKDDFVDESSQAWTWIRENLFNTGKLESVKRDTSNMGPTEFHMLKNAMKVGGVFSGRH